MPFVPGGPLESAAWMTQVSVRKPCEPLLQELGSRVCQSSSKRRG